MKSLCKLTCVFFVVHFLVIIHPSFGGDGDKPAKASTRREFVSTNTEGLIGITEDSPIDNPVDNIFHVSVNESLCGEEKVWLVYELEGVADHTHVSRSINDQVSVGGYLVKRRRGWATQREQVNAAWLKEGDNVIRFTMPENAQHSYRIKNLKLEVESTIENSTDIKVTLNQPSQHYFFDKAYVKGFVSGAGYQNIKVKIDGKEARIFNGEFESIIDFKDAQNSCSVEVEVIYPDSSTTCDKVTFSEPQAVDFNYTLEQYTYRSEKFFDTKKSETLSLNGAMLAATEGALNANTVLSITTLRSVDIPALDGGMVNVTKNSAGFRFLPHGTIFNKEVNVVIPFDTEKIPDGYTEKDIKTYYFDDQSHHWVPLPTDTALNGAFQIVSKTLHFTDYINGIIKVPESPEVEAYNSTSIKGIKAADPTSNVNLIEAPQANHTGTASLSYPIVIPSGRHKMQPDITVAYNSGGGNGWLGLGWDLALPAISIDTRWGTPRFDPINETETYTLNGQQLTPVAHRGKLENRSLGRKQFYPRVEGAFQRIMRYGNTPENYWWELTDKGGTKYLYGASATVGPDPGAVLTDNEAGKQGKARNIAHWALREVRDANGNTVRYHYFKQPDTGLDKGIEPGYQLYIQKITYTGFQGSDGPYTVTFKRDRDLGLTKRRDPVINGTLGFKQVTADLLKKIEVKFGDQNIRSYHFNHTVGAFYKTILQSISEYDSKDSLFNTHTFEYYNDVAVAGKLFGGVETWNPQSDGVRGKMKTNVDGFTDEATAFSGTRSKDLSVGVTVSVGLGANVATKLNSVGGSFGYSQSDSEGVLSMIDVNGDGLQDKLFLIGEQLVYRPNKSGTSTNQAFGDTIHIKGINLFHKEKSKTFNIGVEANALNAIMAGAGGSKTTSKTTTYFTEANGDQLIDIVKNGVVYFNHIDPATGRIRYSSLSSGTHSTIEPGANVSGDLIDREAEELERQKAIDENPLHDIVRMWRAPYAGVVNVTAPVQLLEGTDPERAEIPADGVRVAIQFKDSELWSYIIEANDYKEYKPNSVTNLSVQKGDRIYFRVGSRDNGSYDSVRWSPVVEYVDQDLQQQDANRSTLYRFDAQNDFVLSAAQNISPPINGTVRIAGTWAKPITTDDVDLYLFRSVGESIVKDTLWHKHYRWNEDVSINLDTTGIGVKDNEQYYFKVVSSTNVNWPQVLWKPKMIYTSAEDPEVDVLMNPIEVVAVPEYSLFSYVKSINKPFVVDLKDAKKDTLTITPRLKFTEPPQFALPFTGEIVFSVKKLDTLISKRTLKIESGKIVSKDTTLSVPVRDEDDLFIEYHASNQYLIDGIASHKAYIKGVSLTQEAATGFHTTLPKTSKSEEVIFGHVYRGWGHFAWNGNRDWATQRIDQELLKPSDQIKSKSESKPNVDGLANNDDGRNISGSDTYEANKDRFIILVASGNDQRWNGYDPYVNLDALYMSSSRMGEDDLSALTFNTGTGAGARAIDKINKSTSLSYTIGVSGGGFGVTGSKSESWSNTLTDYVDMNGDRYPDIVSEKIIQYTAANGGLSERTTPVEKNIQQSTAKTTGISISGSGGVPTAKFRRSPKGNPQPAVDAGDARTTNGGAKVTGSVNASAVDGTNDSQFVWMDMNGDGLPDKVNQSNKTVALNVGYSFLTPEVWDFEVIQEGASSTKTGGAGLGINKGNNSFSVGFSLARSDNWTNTSLQDINGDGLPDIVKNGNPISVYLNLGGSFADTPTPWTGAPTISENETASESGNLSFTVGFTILSVKFTVTPSVSGGNGMSREKKKLSDIDGDGYPDFVTSTQDGNLTVFRSIIGRTNLLKQVKRPLGASFTLAYNRIGNTFDMPNSIWALDNVKVFDGFKNDGADNMLTSFQYENGFFDRHEREFYGFRKVITNTHDTQKENSPIYTTITQTYCNDNFYEKGLLLSDVTADNNGNKFSEKENIYTLKNIHDGKDLPSSIKTDSKGNAFPALVETRQKFYEGQSEAGKSTRVTFRYSPQGNVIGYSDFGDEGSEDDISSEISYHTLDNLYIIGTPEKIIVSGSGTKYRHRETVVDESTGNIRQLKQFVSDTDVAVFDMEYDPYGNLKKITRPENAKGQRLSFDYEYETDVNTYTSKVINSYGYTSKADYDLRFGQVLSSKDMNGKEISYELDAKGRVKSITGPYEKGGAHKTIEFEYHPNDSIPWALTKHYDAATPKNKLHTVTFVDGLTRVIQTKKDAAIFAGDGKADVEMMAVSGRVHFDAFGRTVNAYYPVTTSITNPGEFVHLEDKEANPTMTTYDIKNRPLTVTMPDKAVTSTLYGFEQDKFGKKQFSTKTLDANGKQTEQFTDIKGRITSVKNYTADRPVWTCFKYDAIGDQIEATDDLGHTTYSVYDNLGRRIERRHPDAGTSTYSYDLAGNLKQVVSANLLKEGQAIEYVYDHERLVEIIYPQNPENNVKYHYGDAGATDNRAGRIVLQEDATGAQEFFYGPLGEIVKNIRTVVIPQHDEQTYVTEWEYDTWNRLISMTYADGEKVSYTYNQGGLLRSMTGKKKNATFNYVNQLGYDKFDQRVFLAYGNGTKTSYSYEPDRRRLKNMTAQTSAKRVFMDNDYAYDKVNNILNLKNNAPLPTANLMGGASEYSYQYDDLYRLVSAQGTYKAANDEHTYTLNMSYNSVGGITQKNQAHLRKGQEQKKTSYSLTYSYGDTQPHAPIHIGRQTFTYDANGNQTGWTDDASGQRRRIMWDEENRLRAVYDNGALYHYVYDAAGDRVLKGRSTGQRIFVNGEWKAGSGQMGNYTIYVNPYLVLKSGGYTKHYYIEGQRITSKLGGGWDNNGKGPLKAGGNKVDYLSKTQKVFDGIVKNLKFLGSDGQILTAGKSGKVPPGQINGTSGVSESFRYFYHSDHLGSTSYVTDASGEVYQHVEYFAFGETFVEEHSNTDRTPYLFNGKELDEETGLYYYGARYYDPKTSIWMSMDPLAEKYPNMTPYNYAFNNPVKVVDPDGRDGIVAVDQENKTITIKATIYLKGSGATQDIADKANARAANLPSGTYTTKVNGKDVEYKVSFQLNYVYKNDIKDSDLKQGENIFHLKNNTDRAAVSGGGYGDASKGQFTATTAIFGDGGVQDRSGTVKSSEDIATTLIHEGFHFIGLSDRYSDVGPFRESQSHVGWENDIMADSKKSGFSQEHFNNYGKKFAGKKTGTHLLDKMVDRNKFDKLVPASSVAPVK
jgi:RHS repeat-associated protein